MGALSLTDVQAEHLTQPISRLASGDFTAVPVNLTVGGALARIREGGVGEKIIHFYVVDADVCTRFFYFSLPSFILGRK